MTAVSRSAAGAGRLDLPVIIGHRGAAASAPENTLAGIRQAASFGTTWVEFDVRLSADQELVLLHDDTVNRTTDGRGPAASMTVADLKKLDAGVRFSGKFPGERIPTLAETVALLAELGMGANVEIKPAPGAEQATGTAVGHFLTRHWPASLPAVLVSSFKPEALAACRAVAPALARGLLVEAIPATWQADMKTFGCVTLNCSHRPLTADRARAVRATGTPLLCYTVNEPARAAELFGWGVNAVFSDCPDKLSDVGKRAAAGICEQKLAE